MGYNNRRIIGDSEGRPVPQYYNETTDQYEVSKGENGGPNVNVKNFPTTQNVKMTSGSLPDTEALPVRSSGLEDFTNGSVTVTATEVEIKASTSAMNGRKQMIVYPPDAGVIYWGKSGVTSSTGAPLKSTDPALIFDFNPNLPISIFAVNDGTNRNIRVVEMK